MSSQSNSPERPRFIASAFTFSALILVAAGAPHVGCSPASPSGSNGDKNGDGVLDSLGTTYDRNGDGSPDGFDVDGDGVNDGVGVDTNGDGEFDAAAIDKDGDRLRETLVFPDGSEIEGDPPGDGDGDMTGDGDSTIVVGSGGQTSGDGDGMDEEYCNDFAATFEPKTPTVYVLVDRSQSMFGADEFWETLKAGVLPVIDELDEDVRFGFGSYTGTGQMCTGLTEGAPIAENNYDAIAAAYNELDFFNQGETPTALAVAQAAEVLLADQSPGDRFILLVTDGDPDFCDNPDPACGYDALIASLQSAYRQGVQTLVFGIENNAVTPEVFDYFAQAGIGEEPAYVVGVEETRLNGCSNGTGDGAWTRFKTENGGVNGAGLYSEAGGTATAFLDADPAVVAAEIRKSVAGLKSCTFELNFEVTDASTGEIFVGDLNTAIPQSQWRMVEGAEDNNILELTGDACTKWKDPAVINFFAGFPCEAIVEIIR